MLDDDSTVWIGIVIFVGTIDVGAVVVAVDAVIVPINVVIVPINAVIVPINADIIVEDVILFFRCYCRSYRSISPLYGCCCNSLL